MAVLTDYDTDWGIVLTLMKAGRGAQVRYPGNFHIGFFVDRKEPADEIHRRLIEDDAA